jgi:catechol 2,3-dioxygenase-like lactoylglutathione lyase family enzyme
MVELPQVQKLLHFAQVATDIGKTQRWYAKTLGATIPPPESGFPPRITLADMVIDLFPAGGTTPAGLPLGSPVPGSIGQHHAFEIKLQDFDNWVDHFRILGQTFRKAAHGMRFMSIYLDDPDGYHIELTVPFQDETTGRSEMDRRGLVPLYLKT